MIAFTIKRSILAIVSLLLVTLMLEKHVLKCLVGITFMHSKHEIKNITCVIQPSALDYFSIGCINTQRIVQSDTLLSM